MAAHSANSALELDKVDAEDASQQRQLLEFAKFQKQNPSLDGEEAVKSFLSAQQQQQQQQQSPAQSPVNTNAIQRSSSIQIGGCGGGLQAASPSSSLSLTLSGFRPESCPQTSTFMPLAGSQRMVRGNSTNPQHTSPQHAFALRAGRSPTQFTNAVPVTSTDPPLAQFTSAPTAPTFQTLHSLGLDVTGNTPAALHEYLVQKDHNDPFPLALRPESFAGSRSNKGYPPPPLTIYSFSAPQMRSQPSSQLSSSFTDDSVFLDIDLSAGSPQNKHSRSFTRGSAESEPYLFGQHEMRRQESGASVFDAGFSMLRVHSSTGSMGDVFPDDMEDHLLCGVGGFAGNGEDLGRVAGQVVLKRSSEELDGRLSGRADYYSLGSAGLKKQKMLKEEDLKEEEGVVKQDLMHYEKIEEKKMVEEILQRPPLSPPPPQPKSDISTNVKNEPKSEPKKPISTTRQKPATAPRPLPTIKPGKNPNTSPTLTASTKSTYVRPPHPRVFCTKCSAHPEGFRGDHELRRHTDREHALTRKMWVIKDISKGKTLLAKCKACQSGKKYGVDYNAAAHLRRQHFKPKVRSGKGNKKAAAVAAASAGTLEHSVPEMAVLREWMFEVEVTVPPEKTSFKGVGDHTTTTTSTTHQDESDTSEDNEDEDGNDGDSQETDNQPATLDSFVQNMPPSGGLPNDNFAWASWDNNASYIYGDQKILQHFTHQSGIQTSVGAGSIPLAIPGGFSQAQHQHAAAHNSLLPTQQAVMMMMMHSELQPNSHQMQQQLPYFAHEVDGGFGECLIGPGAVSGTKFELGQLFPGINID